MLTKWAIRQDLDQSVCDWFRKFRDTDNAFLEGGFKYLFYDGINTRFMDIIPAGYQEINLQQFKQLTMNTNQSVPHAGMKAIYDVACDAWKKKIEKLTSVFGDTVLSKTQVEEMFAAANVDQTKVLDKWLKRPQPTQINSWEDVVASVGEPELPYKNPKTREEKSVNAMVKGFAIAKAFNGDWVPDWSDSDQYKYQPYKYWSGGRWVVRYYGFDRAFCVSGLCFKSSELAMKAYELFPEVYDDYYMITG